MKGLCCKTTLTLITLVIMIITLLMIILLSIYYVKNRDSYYLESINYQVVSRFNDKDKAARLLNQMDKLGNNIMNYLSVRKDTAFKKSVFSNIKKYKFGNIMETDPLWTMKNKAATNRDMIRLCLRKKDGSFYPIETLMFVYLHELSHVGTDKKYIIKGKNKVDSDHPREFWATFHLLLKYAEEFNFDSKMYSVDNFEIYCDTKIVYNPRFDTALESIINY